jgi:hypothetical protein
MRGIECVNCEKFRCDFMAQTCALIVPFQPVLHRVSSINETLPNAPKHYDTHQNMSLGFNWVDRVCSFWKILTRLHGTNLCINSIISACFASTFVQQRNNPKCTQTPWNAPNHESRVQWGGSGSFAATNSKFRAVTKHCQMHPNTMKHTKTGV